MAVRCASTCVPQLPTVEERPPQELEGRRGDPYDLPQGSDELQAMCEGMTDGLLIADVETKRFVHSNHAICRMLGYAQEELRSLSVNEIHPPQELPWILEEFRAQAEGQVSKARDIPLLRKDGTVFYAHVTGTPATYNRRPCLIGFFRDVTERRQAEEELRTQKQSLRDLLLTSEHERRTIASDIHHNVGHSIAACLMQFEAYRDLRNEQPLRAASIFDAAMTVLRQCYREVQRLTAMVRPLLLDDLGLVAAVAELVKEHDGQDGLRIEFVPQTDFDRLEVVAEVALYRIVLEGLTNARKHSRSAKARIELIQHAERIRIVIQDWGIGFDPNEISKYHFGLQGIRERARLLGGTATIEATPGKGTCVTVDVPLLERDAKG
jgi:PAS domain S-box-containing protein